MANQDTPTTASHTRSIQDHRPRPAGALPRQFQMWLMVGIALVILVIIVVTGHPAPNPRVQTMNRPTLPTLPPTDRIRGYEQQLTQEVERQQMLAQQRAQGTASGLTPDSDSPPPSDPLVEDQRRRAYQSLFAENVAFSRRPTGQQASTLNGLRPSLPQVTPPVALPAAAVVRPTPEQTNGARTTSASNAMESPATMAASDLAPLLPAEAAASPARDEYAAGGLRLRLLEGTVIETVLLNRLDGTFSGPVNALVTTPVYSHDRQSVLIPAGARVLGAAAPLQAWGDSRLAISFHRLVMPDGHTYSLDVFKGLDQIGATGLRDDVNRHYLQVFGASLAIGALSGLAQYNTRGGFETSSVGDAYRQAAGASLATSTSRVLDRYLNVLPTITITEGYRIKVYLTNDLNLPAYTSAEATGGAQ